MNQEERIERTRKDFHNKASIFTTLFEQQQEREGLHWRVRLAFVAFIGVLFTIVSANKQDYSDRFISRLSWIVFIAMTLMVVELIRGDWDSKTAMRKSERLTKLAKVRHIASMEDRFESYAKSAEYMLIAEDPARKRMMLGDSLSEIIKTEKNNFFWFSFVVWPLLYLSMPILLLMESFKHKL